MTAPPLSCARYNAVSHPKLLRRSPPAFRRIPEPSRGVANQTQHVRAHDSRSRYFLSRNTLLPALSFQKIGATVSHSSDLQQRTAATRSNDTVSLEISCVSQPPIIRQ